MYALCTNIVATQRGAWNPLSTSNLKRVRGKGITLPQPSVRPPVRFRAWKLTRHRQAARDGKLFATFWPKSRIRTPAFPGGGRYRLRTALRPQGDKNFSVRDSPCLLSDGVFLRPYRSETDGRRRVRGKRSRSLAIRHRDPNPGTLQARHDKRPAEGKEANKARSQNNAPPLVPLLSAGTNEKAKSGGEARRAHKCIFFKNTCALRGKGKDGTSPVRAHLYIATQCRKTCIARFARRGQGKPRHPKGRS